MAVAVRSPPSRQQREGITHVAAQVAGALEPHGRHEQQRQQELPSKEGILVVSPAVVGREVLGQRRIQRLYQPSLVGCGQEQERARTLSPLGLSWWR